MQGRAKHIYSIHQKMEKYAAQGKTFDDLYDLLAVRVLVDTVADCYHALGVVHDLWRPIPGQFDDYIANPRESVYQSLHTTVLCLGARPLEVQIRTHEMHRVAEYGVAAHWRYKEGGKRDHRFEERIAWLRQLLDWQRDMADADEFVELVKTDIFHDQVFVFTPKGEIKDLPASSTPIDFAYRIHTDLGHRCVGAQGQRPPGLAELPAPERRRGRGPDQQGARGPSRDWLNPNLGYVMTSHAREKIRQWFKQQERDENIERGRDLLDKELRRLGAQLLRSARTCSCAPSSSMTWTTSSRRSATAASASTRSRRRLAPLVQPQEEAAELAIAAPQKAVYTANVEVLGTGDLLTTARPLLQPRARRPDRRLRDARPRRDGAPPRLRQRPARGREGAPRRGRVGAARTALPGRRAHRGLGPRRPPARHQHHRRRREGQHGGRPHPGAQRPHRQRLPDAGDDRRRAAHAAA